MPVALVTAGSHGLGRAIADDLSAKGWHVGITYRGHEEEARSFTGNDKTRGCIQAHLEKEAEVQHVFATVRRAFGKIDAVVHCAGSFELANTEDTNEPLWNMMMRDNASTTLFTLKSAVNHMRERAGSIVVLASPQIVTGKRCVAYSAANAARLQTVKDVADGLRDSKIAINALTFRCAENSRNKPPLDVMPASEYTSVKDIVLKTRKLLTKPGGTGMIVDIS